MGAFHIQCNVQLVATGPLAHGPLSNAMQAEECNVYRYVPAKMGSLAQGQERSLHFLLLGLSRAVNMQQMANAVLDETNVHEQMS